MGLGEFNGDWNEEINLPFENDEAVIGHWKMLDYLPCKEMFHPTKRKSATGHDNVKELYFLPGGEWYWCFGWTKGMLLSNCGYPYRKSHEYDRVFPMDIMPEQLVKAMIARNLEKMEQLGAYEVAPEDFALCEFVCTSKIETQRIVREALNYMRKELE